MRSIKELKKAVEDSIDENLVGQIATRARTSPEMQRRWMEYCGVDSPDKIDYSNPEVYIEFCACDPTIYRLADDPAAFIEATKCDPETFFKYYDVKLPDSRFEDEKGRRKAYVRACRPHLKKRYRTIFYNVTYKNR